jgi:hypothetical protein
VYRREANPSAARMPSNLQQLKAFTRLGGPRSSGDIL